MGENRRGEQSMRGRRIMSGVDIAEMFERIERVMKVDHIEAA
jgi:hypothetical protein